MSVSKPSCQTLQPYRAALVLSVCLSVCPADRLSTNYDFIAARRAPQLDHEL